MSDTELLKIINSSDETGYCELVKKYGSYVKAIVTGVLGKTGTREDIEECVTDVLVKIILEKDRLDEHGETFKSYLGTSARNKAVDTYRKIAGQARYMTDEDIENAASVMHDSSTPETVLSGKFIRNMIWKSVDKLGPPDSDIIYGQYLCGKTAAQISKELSMSVMTVHKRSLRARKKLQKIFEEFFEKENIDREDLYEKSAY